MVTMGVSMGIRAAQRDINHQTEKTSKWIQMGTLGMVDGLGFSALLR